jgi:hypothetical protein
LILLGSGGFLLAPGTVLSIARHTSRTLLGCVASIDQLDLKKSTDGMSGGITSQKPTFWPQTTFGLPVTQAEPAIAAASWVNGSRLPDTYQTKWLAAI